MGARKQYTYHPRKTRTGYVWEYSINEEAGLPYAWCERRRSSGIPVTFGRGNRPTQRSEEEILRFCMRRAEELRAAYRQSVRAERDPTLGDIIEPYYDYNRCPHIQRLLTDGRGLTWQWAAWQRQRVDDYILADPIARIRYAELTPGDLEEWKRRLRASGVTLSVINKTIGALKTALGEETRQGRLDRNPAIGVGLIEAVEAERGYFTHEELYRMFVSEAPECWRSHNPKHKSPHGRVGPETAHLMALFHFLTGERMAAILKLHWQDIEFGAGVVTYRRTKTQKERMAPLPATLVSALFDHADRSIRIAPGDYVFSYDSGEPIGYTFFRKRYANMMAALALPRTDPDGYERTPYSLKVSLETHLIDAGADPVHVREYTGHSHGAGEKRLTRVQARYKRRRVEVLRERIIPLVDALLSEVPAE